MTETLSSREEEKKARKKTNTDIFALFSSSLVNVKTTDKKRKQKAIEWSLANKRRIKADDFDIFYFLLLPAITRVILVNCRHTTRRKASNREDWWSTAFGDVNCLSFAIRTTRGDSNNDHLLILRRTNDRLRVSPLLLPLRKEKKEKLNWRRDACATANLFITLALPLCSGVGMRRSSMRNANFNPNKTWIYHHFSFVHWSNFPLDWRWPARVVQCVIAPSLLDQSFFSLSLSLSGIFFSVNRVVSHTMTRTLYCSQVERRSNEEAYLSNSDGCVLGSTRAEQERRDVEPSACSERRLIDFKCRGWWHRSTKQMWRRSRLLRWSTQEKWNTERCFSMRRIILTFHEQWPRALNCRYYDEP